MRYFKSPEDIQKFMSNISYGIISRKDNKVLNDWDGWKEFGDVYRLQSPELTKKFKAGVCWDQTELERELFKKYLPDHKVRTFGIIQKNPNMSSHTFLTFETPEGKKFYLENSYGRIRGLYPIKDEKEAIAKVYKAMKEDEADKGAMFFEYTKPRYGLKVPTFMNYLGNSKRLRIK